MFPRNILIGFAAILGSAVLHGEVISSYMTTGSEMQWSVPKKQVVLKEKGGKGIVSANAKTANNGTQDSKFDFDKKAGNIHEVRKPNGVVLFKDFDHDAIGAIAEKGDEKSEYAKGTGWQYINEKTRTVGGEVVPDGWTIDLTTSAKAQADSKLKDSSASAKGTSEDPWSFQVIAPDDEIFVNFKLTAGTGFGATGAGAASSGSFFLGTDIPGLEEILRVEMGTPKQGSTSPWFHVITNTHTGLTDAAIQSALSAAFKYDPQTSSYLLTSDLGLTSIVIPTAGLPEVSFSMGSESDANAGVPEPGMLLPVCAAFCILRITELWRQRLG